MERYDGLPRRARDTLKAAPLPADLTNPMADLLRRGYTVDTAISKVRGAYRQLMAKDKPT